VHLTRLLVGALAVGNGIGGTRYGQPDAHRQAATALRKLSVPATLKPFSGWISVRALYPALWSSAYRARTISTNSTGTIAASHVRFRYRPPAAILPPRLARSHIRAAAPVSERRASGTITASHHGFGPRWLRCPASACTGGGGSCSSSDPATVNVNFILADSPGYSTGAYSATGEVQHQRRLG